MAKIEMSLSCGILTTMAPMPHAIPTVAHTQTIVSVHLSLTRCSSQWCSLPIASTGPATQDRKEGMSTLHDLMLNFILPMTWALWFIVTGEMNAIAFTTSWLRFWNRNKYFSHQPWNSYMHADVTKTTGLPRLYFVTVVQVCSLIW